MKAKLFVNYDKADKYAEEKSLSIFVADLPYQDAEEAAFCYVVSEIVPTVEQVKELMGNLEIYAI